ncbi:uncharacterized protein LOC129804111 isoform X2 [Phlebotomus papatasi]|uniref:uncharacterized protein LOC129804111 isoform X2 n=1 Tax=Phlebotomus papatasi TaxID=29031 RepID=UPI0024844C6F|nr:uncharacterized protein LOC129804111 isoform X2 [Phlebotomus papatasi]
MDIDNAKENIQPLASGRNISLLEAALHAETHQDAHRELMQKREEFERRIAEYCGDDPLELWYDYILWIEQCYPKSGKQSAFDDVLVKCITTLENDERYHQDRRMVKIYIKFIDSQQSPHEHYNTLYNQGIGTLIADLYICWAYYFEILENFERAEKIYSMGFDAGAQPFDELKQAHDQFLVSVAQRTLYRDEKMRQTFFSTMEERRNALTSLSGHRSNRVGSIRTGGVVRDVNPGRVEQTFAASHSRAPYQATTTSGIAIYVDAHQESFNGPPEASTSSGIRSIVSSATKQENQWEPGPWSKAKKRTQSNALFPSAVVGRPNTKLEFDIMEDTDEWCGPARLPANFARTNYKQDDFSVNVMLMEDLPGGIFPMYDKILCYPNAKNIVFSPEELRAYRWFRNRGRRAAVTEELKDFVENSYDNGVRLPENFRRTNEKQDVFPVDKCKAEVLVNQELMCRVEAMNMLNDKEEMSFEELQRVKYERSRAARKRTTNEFCIPQPPQTQQVNMNDTCSTQTFNFFIKPQSVSTPKPDLKKFIVTPRSSLSLYQPPSQPAVDVPRQPDVNLGETEEAPVTATTKQLSTIWEVSEPSTTTSSSGTSTKSSTSSADSPDNVPGELRPTKFPQTTPTVISAFVYQGATTDGRCAGNSSIKMFREEVSSVNPITVYEDPTTENLLAPPKIIPAPDDDYYSEFFQSPPEATKRKEFGTKISPQRANDSLTFPSMREMAVSGMTSSIFGKRDMEGVLNTSKIGGSAQREVRLVSGNGSGAAGPIFSDSTRPTHSQNGQSMGLFPPVGPFASRVVEEEDDDDDDDDNDDDDEDVEIVDMKQFGNTSRSFYSPPLAKVPKIMDVHSVREPQHHVWHSLSVIKEGPVPPDSSFTFPPSNLQTLDGGAKKEDTVGNLNESVTVPHMENVWANDEAKDWSGRKSMDERKSLIVSHVSENDPLRMTITMRDGNKNASMANNSVYVKQSPQNNRTGKITRQDFPSPAVNGTDSGQSIYMMPNNSVNGASNPEDDWSEDDNQPLSSYQRKEVDMNETQQVIDDNLGLEVMNPFNPKLINAFLEKADFMNFLESLDSCILTNIVKMIKPNSVMEMNGMTLDVGKLLGSGTFGKVYHAKCRETGNCYALKQERPANLWEYYIVLELKYRMHEMNQSLMSAFVDVEFAMIGNNASILALPFCRYGTLVNVCNVHKFSTEKNLHEFIVIMLATQIFSIIDHLHACNIIHADIKPDNFMLTSKLNYDSPYSALKLIDFGQSIDMKLFPENTTFKYVVKTEGFTCTEMLEDKPWTYQTDLFGVAATIHVLLFGKYMNVTKGYSGWVMTTKLPRYFQKAMWERIFSKLLNIRDCQSMPNLQDMKLMLKKELALKEQMVRDQIIKFNSVLDNYKPGL